MLDEKFLRALASGGTHAMPMESPEAAATRATQAWIAICTQVASSPTIYQHAVDGSENAKVVIGCSLAFLRGILQGLMVNGQPITVDPMYAADAPADNA